MQTSILVIGLGNPILGDDGIGWRVAEGVAARLAEYNREGIEVDCLSLGGLSLMERMIGYQRVILIDSIQTGGASDGDLHVLRLEDLPDFSTGHSTAVHDTSLQNALAVGRQLGADLPDDIRIVAVEAAQVFDFSESLSPRVAAAIPSAIEAVWTQIRSMEGTK